MRLLSAATALLLAAAGAYVLARAVAPPPAVSPELSVEQRLRCPQCTQMRLDVCDRPVCTDMKADVRRRLQNGESADSILSSFAARYGPEVLAEPAAPLEAATWVPWLAVLLALALLAWGWRLRSRAPGGASA